MSDTPKRIQRKRTQGWRLPPNTVCVSRPSIFGNPFSVDAEHTQEWTVNQYRLWLSGQRATGAGGLRRISLLFKLPLLRGKDLACWCPLVDKDGKRAACHAEFLLELANQ